MPERALDEGVRHTRRRILIAGATAPIWLPNTARLLAQEQTAPPPSGRSGEAKIIMTIVYDNNAGPKHLGASWGFSCLVQGLEKTILFDTGEHGDLLLRNMERLELDPKEIDVVVLSHIHVDHTGGLRSVVRDRSGMPVYTPAGFPTGFIDRVRSLGTKPIAADESTEICPGVRTTGTLGKGAIVEHGLCVKTRKGWVLITGCAHPGADKMAEQAKQVAGPPLHLVVGGYHMGRQPESRINAVIERFEELGVQRAAPCHCSGELTRKLFKERLGGRCSLVGVGDVFRFRTPDTGA
jgi:7,8-dihydropterin-6-yl-methyl-4-(beta-D-ribofuranosyl)aminobenzene 5'-phosphate synthase